MPRNIVSAGAARASSPVRIGTTRPTSASPVLPKCLEELRRNRLLESASPASSPAVRDLKVDATAAALAVALPVTCALGGESGPGHQSQRLHSERVHKRIPTCDERPGEDMAGVLQLLLGHGRPSAPRCPHLNVGTHAGANQEATGESENNPSLPVASMQDNSEDGERVPSIALVLDCLDAVLMKFQSEDAWRLAGSGFLERTLPAVAEATKERLQASLAQRSELDEKALQLQMEIRDKQRHLESLKDGHQELARKSVFRLRQARKLGAELRTSQDAVDELEKQLQVAVARHAELQEFTEKTLQSAQEDWDLQRAALVEERDERASENARLESATPIAQQNFLKLQEEVAAADRRANHTEIEASLLSEAQDRLESSEQECSRLRHQVDEAEAKQAEEARERKRARARRGRFKRKG